MFYLVLAPSKLDEMDNSMNPTKMKDPNYIKHLKYLQN